MSRTRDLIIANDALYQLSYRPMSPGLFEGPNMSRDAAAAGCECMPPPDVIVQSARQVELPREVPDFAWKRTSSPY